MINKRAQTFFIFFMLALAIIIVVLGAAPSLKQVTDDARASGQLDCANTSISDFDKGACTTSDISIFLWIGGMVAIAGIVMGVGRVL